jgi:hypothetical protein
MRVEELFDTYWYTSAFLTVVLLVITELFWRGTGYRDNARSLIEMGFELLLVFMFLSHPDQLPRIVLIQFVFIALGSGLRAATARTIHAVTAVGFGRLSAYASEVPFSSVEKLYTICASFEAINALASMWKFLFDTTAFPLHIPFMILAILWALVRVLYFGIALYILDGVLTSSSARALWTPAFITQAILLQHLFRWAAKEATTEIEDEVVKQESEEEEEQEPYDEEEYEEREDQFVLDE